MSRKVNLKQISRCLLKELESKELDEKVLSESLKMCLEDTDEKPIRPKTKYQEHMSHCMKDEKKPMAACAVKWKEQKHV
jgi:hypothetical protein